LENRRLPGLGGRDDHRTLALPYGTEQIDDPVGVVPFPSVPDITLEEELFIGVKRAETIELGTVTSFVRGTPVHEFEMREWRGLPILRTPSDAPIQLVARP
jgi:hypothetical protein